MKPVLRLVLLVGAAAATPVAAAPLLFSGTIRADLGYAENPFLVNGQNKGEGYGAITFSPVLTKQTSVSTTTLSGQYYREQYFSSYGDTETISVGLAHKQQINEHLQANLQVNYISTDNALLSPNFDPTLVDVLTTGQRSRVLSAQAGVTWQIGARDSVSFEPNAVYSTVGGSNRLMASSYTQYGGTVQYQHVLSARTTVGALVTASKVDSHIYPSSNSINPGISLVQILSPIWTLDGNVGVILQHIDGPFPSSTTGVSFLARLCGKYTYRTLCIQGSRQSTASGIGGLRTDLEAEVTLIQRLSERSSISGTLVYDDSTPSNHNEVISRLIAIQDQRVLQARIDYTRTLTQRLAAGTSARVQWREEGSFGNARSIGGSVFLSYKIGRL